MNIIGYSRSILLGVHGGCYYALIDKCKRAALEAKKAAPPTGFHLNTTQPAPIGQQHTTGTIEESIKQLNELLKIHGAKITIKTISASRKYQVFLSPLEANQQFNHSLATLLSDAKLTDSVYYESADIILRLKTQDFEAFLTSQDTLNEFEEAIDMIIKRLKRKKLAKEDEQKLPEVGATVTLPPTTPPLPPQVDDAKDAMIQSTSSDNPAQARQSPRSVVTHALQSLQLQKIVYSVKSLQRIVLALDNDNLLKQPAQALMDALDGERKTNPSYSFDDLLQTAGVLINEGITGERIEMLKAFATSAPGQPSLGKQVVSAILGLVGVAAACIGVTLLCTGGLGIIAPVVTTGIGISAAVTCGYSFFYHREKGVAKAIRELVDGAHREEKRRAATA